MHVLHKNHDLLIVRAGDTNGDGRIGTVGQFLCVFCDVTVGGVCLWLAKGLIGIDLFLVLNFAPEDAEVIDEVKDGEISVACEVLL